MATPYPRNETKAKLQAGGYAFGVAIADISGIILPHLFAQMGYDSLFFDTEHSPDSFGTTCDLMWSCRRSGITPIIRVPDPERFFMSRALDAGAQGVIVPRVETVAQVDHIVSCCRFGPEGTRGVAMGGRHTDFQGASDWKDTFRQANEQVFVAIMIETTAGLEAVDALAARPGIDMLFIGPTDLSVAVGTPGKLDSPAMDRAIDRIVAAAQRHGLMAGVQGTNLEMATRWMKRGVRYVLLGNILGLIRQSGVNGLARLREAAQTGPGAAPATSGPGLRARARESLARGCSWLESQIDARGQIQGLAEAAAYYKSPAVLALAGRREAAQRCLGWIEGHFLGKKGELVLPAEQESKRPFNTYDRGWIAWGAMLCGRYDLAFRMADDILAFQDPATGGFWDSQAARAARAGRQHAMTAGMAGLALLATRQLEGARRAASFLQRVLDLQPDPAAGLHLAMEVTAAGAMTPRLQQSPMDYLDRSGLKQRPARLGPAQVLLARLYRTTGDVSYLQTAQAYTQAVLSARDGAYLCVEGHKFVWGLTELARLTPASEGTAHAAAADQIVAYLVSRQQPEGNWLEDSGVADPTLEQPLPRRIDVTCNVLAGLAHFGGWTPASP